MSKSASVAIGVGIVFAVPFAVGLVISFLHNWPAVNRIGCAVGILCAVMGVLAGVAKKREQERLIQESETELQNAEQGGGHVR